MNAQKFTQKSLEAIQNSQELSLEHQNMQIEVEHLLYALVTQEQGLIPQLLLKMGVNLEGFEAEVKRDVYKRQDRTGRAGRQPDGRRPPRLSRGE